MAKINERIVNEDDLALQKEVEENDFYTVSDT
jgi:hypothetical protein